MINQIANILSSVWMIDPNFIKSNFPLLLHFLNGGKIDLLEQKETIFSKNETDEETEKKAKENPYLYFFNRDKLKNLQHSSINLTTDYSSGEIEENTIAVHPIWGVVFADSRWYFGTKQFEKNLRIADNNPNIIAHFVPVSSPGGDAHYLDVAAETIRNLKKPKVVHYERTMASAAFYLGSGATAIFANSKFDRVGSIGTMFSFLDYIPMLEKWGAKYIEEYATLSTMKNKLENDLINGDPDEFRMQVLDPLNNGFIETIKTNRLKVIDAPKEKGVLNGAMFFAEDAMAFGLIDGIKRQYEAINHTYDLGMANQINNSIQ